jgi:hypothetical protein
LRFPFLFDLCADPVSATKQTGRFQLMETAWFIVGEFEQAKFPTRSKITDLE